VMDVVSSFNLSEESSRKIADAIKYQAVVYQRVFDPDTFGLSAVEDKAKFRLKRHYFCPTEHGVLVVNGCGQAFLLSKDGEYHLSKPEGKISLKPSAAFKQVKNINTIKFTEGEVHKNFASILGRRGYL